MKIKSLLIGMLACTALVGCSDDDVLNNSELEKPQAENIQAYLTFSIASSENSSRAVNDGTTVGDSDGNIEHSGHENVGTVAENKINDIMIVFYNSTSGKDEGFVGNYTINYDATSGAFENTTTQKHNKIDTELVYDNSNNTYSLKNPFTLKSTGDYKVLVVVNPNATLKAKTGVTTSAAAKTVFEDIIKGSASTISDIIGTADSPNFMMTNRGAVSITVGAEHNDPDNAATTTNAIEVERVVSKIAFRPSTLASAPSEFTDKNNLYKITVNNYDYQMIPEEKWISNGDDDQTTADKDETTYTLYTNMYPAKIGENKVYVYTTKDATTNKVTTKLYSGTGKTHTGETADGKKHENVEIIVAYTGVNKDFRYEGTKVPANPATTDYYIRLTDYTLVNLNNSVYYVRHTSSSATPADPAACYWGGIVSSTNYLIEPNTAYKSVTGWPADLAAAESYFGDTAIEKVTTAIASDAYTGFVALPTIPEEIDDVTGFVTPEDPATNATESTHTNASTIGNHMAYCFENNVVETNMNNKTTTGIIFKASIFNADGTPVKPMFNYDGSFYPSLETLIAATSDDKGFGSPFYGLTDEDYAAENITDEELKSMGITPYPKGECYYFSAEIKHYDDGDNAKKPMEYAIMRNNIYSLSVSNINTFGFSSLNINDGILNTEEETENLYMSLKAKVMPWIVRFNNITF